MRAGDIRQRDLLVILPARQRRIRRPAGRGAIRGAVLQVERLFGDLDAVDVDALAALVLLRDVVGAARRREQHPARHWIRPRARQVEVRLVLVLGRRFRRHQRAALRPEQRVDAVAVVLKRSADNDLVLLGRLECEAEAVVAIEVVAVRRPGEVGLVEHALRLLQLVPVDARGVLLRDALARRAKEPQLVPLERAADAGCRLDELLDRREACRGDAEAAREQLVVDVVALQVRPGEREVRDAGEDVAAVLRDHVQLHAAGIAVRSDAARLGDHFLKGGAVEDEDACIGRCHLGVHAVDDRLRVRRAVNREPGLRPIAQRAGCTVAFVVQHRPGQHRNQR